MNKTFAATAILGILLSTSCVLALGITAGTVRILVDVGETGSSSFGLLNKGNETITVGISVDGDAAQFIKVPASADLPPMQLVYVTVEATVPSAYDGSLGGTIEGAIYAVQQGEPGQVQINVQARKTVQVLIPKYGGSLPETAQPSSQSEESNAITGMASMPSISPLLLIPVGVGIVVVAAYFVLTRFDISIKKKRR
jgi:hypothetical protein